MTTRSDIADLAERYEGLIPALSITWPLILHPAHPLAEIAAIYLVDGGPGDDLPFELKDAPGDPEPIVLSSKQVFERVAASAAETPTAEVRVLSVGMAAAAIHIHDEIKAAGFHCYRDPFLEFLRHFRNACAHGDRWTFTKKEPSNEAHFGDLIVGKELEGRRATFETVGPKTFILLLRAVQGYFRQPSERSQ